MPQVWKEIIRPGKHVYIDGDNKPAVLNATPEHLKHWFDSGKAMLTAGLAIPVPLEHDPKAKPMTAAEKAANQVLHNAGWIQDYKIEKIKDEKGRETQALFGLHDIPDPNIFKRLPHTIKWVSPWISSFVDGAGRAWSNVISHSALTTRPRIAQQLPFPNVSAALSLAAPAPDPMTMPIGGGFALSRAGLLNDDGKPAYPRVFSLMAGVRLAVEDLKASPKKKPEAKPPPKKEGAEPVASEGGGEPPKPEGEKPPMGGEDPNALLQPIEEALVDPDGDISVHEVLCDLLETVDIMLEEGTPENFEERLYKALMDKMKMDKAGDDTMADQTNPNPAAPPSPEPKVAPPPMYMSQQPVALSLEQIKAITDPTLKSLAFSLHQQQERNAALEKHAFTQAGEARQKRLGKILPMLNEAAQKKLLERAKGAQFSLGADGTVKDDLDEVLDMLDGHVLNGIDLPALLTNPQAALAVMPHPKELGGGTTTDRVKQVVNEQMKNSGKKPVYETNGAK